MERAVEHLTIRETLLLVVDAAGGTVEGRTPIQKLCYFAARDLDQSLGHHAHYYGPYSREVDVALQNETFAGDLNESMRTFHNAGSSREGRQYSYELTGQGKSLVDEIRAAKPEAAVRVDRLVKRLGELVPGYRQRPLSLAAKVDLILHQRGDMDAAEIPTVAQGLGWKVSKDDVDQAVKTLVGLGRVTQP